MRPLAKRKNKIQARLGQLRLGKNHCWVCRSTSGVKTAREATGTRCRTCIAEGKTTPEVIEYEKLKAELAALGSRK